MFRSFSVFRLAAAGVACVWSTSVAQAASSLPKVWTSTSGLRTTNAFACAVADCRAHGVDVMECRSVDEVRDVAAFLAIARKHGMKLHVSASDTSKRDHEAKKTGRYELAVMQGGCYRGLAIDRHLFAFSAAKHEIIVEPPVYSPGQVYAKHPHYYMLGDGHYFGGYVPTGKAEVVVPEKLFDGRQHLRIIPATITRAPVDARPEIDSAASFLEAKEIKNRALYRVSFDLSGCAGCRLDKVGLAVYWAMDDKSPGWLPDRTCYSVFSPVTRERMRRLVRTRLDVWTRANGGTFPADTLVGMRLGDEIFNATGWVSAPCVSFPLWDYSASALAAFKAASPEGITHPRTWGAPEVYGPDACAQFLYLFHKACADYIKEAVAEGHAVSPSLKMFRNTTRGDVWSYANDHDGTSQELLAEALDLIHLDPYPVTARRYEERPIPFDMAYCAGLARRYDKGLMPWMQAHQFMNQLVHPKPEDIDRMWAQMKPFAPDAIMWLGYRPKSSNMTFPSGDPASWARAAQMHDAFKAMPPPVRSRPMLAVLRPYSARAVVCETKKGFVHPADVILREFVYVWSCVLKQPYDIFEIPPYETPARRDVRQRELAQYGRVVSSVDLPGSFWVAKGQADKTLSRKALRALRATFEETGRRWLQEAR